MNTKIKPLNLGDLEKDVIFFKGTCSGSFLGCFFRVRICSDCSKRRLTPCPSCPMCLKIFEPSIYVYLRRLLIPQLLPISAELHFPKHHHPERRGNIARGLWTKSKGEQQISPAQSAPPHHLDHLYAGNF